MANEPGPRGSSEFRWPPRGPGSATINHHVTALAAERQGVGHAGPLVGAKGFWRRRKGARGRRCDGPDGDRGGPLTSSAAQVGMTAAIVLDTVGSASAPASSRGWLVSRTRPARVRWPVPRRRSGATIRAPRRTRSGSTGNVCRASASLDLGGRLGPGARSRCPTCRCS
jgi:hypothetical protein